MDSDHSADLERLGITYDVLLDFVRKQRIGTELLLASIIIYVYDILTTFDLEVQFVWMVKPHITLAKVLFALNRYVPMVGFVMRFIHFTHQTPTNPLCELSSVSAYLAVINFASVELVLMLRIWVLYARSKRVGALMVVSFLVTIGAGLALRTVQPAVVAGDVVIPPLTVTICKRSPPSEYFWGYLFGTLLEVFVFSLLLNKVHTAWKTRVTSPIIDALLNHGSFYYLTVISMFVFTVVSSTTSVLYWPIMDSDIAICISCVACNHLILSLRGLYYSSDSTIAPTSGGGYDLHPYKTPPDNMGRGPNSFTGAFAQVPSSTIGSATLDEEERTYTMR